MKEGKRSGIRLEERGGGQKKQDIKSFTLEELQAELTGRGEKPYRAKQMYEWMHKRAARSLDEMSNLSLEFRADCAQRYEYTVLVPEQEQESAANSTKKFLFRLQDGHMVESVLMKYRHGHSVCVSSQVGCRMGCRFCASGTDGLIRSLKPSEMLDQVYAIGRMTGERISHVTVMGSGEPLDNYENLLRFLKLLTDENGLNISQRNITVSTCGLVPKIRRLARENLQLTLAVSLHGATDEKRRKLMPVADRYGIEETMEACAAYFKQTGRRITLEYSLVAGVNDSIEDAAKLARLAKPLHCHVNLIPVNPVKEHGCKPPQAPVVQSFKNRLEKNKINVTIRRELGRDIDASCGQLRRRRQDGADSVRKKSKDPMSLSGRGVPRN
ncbi:MAG: 23S rRNA (adenine(2503)-C(2))-methyltransferase RlmN [Clostridium sp.]|jgi:23S rRNA (adenine2503-C2)-methyltransferase|nr:23S rRNA (adenine(2503)-C(2))-methyltransferase RlmN [Clostridium sp.]